MSAQPKQPPLRQFNGEKIPQELKDQRRWAPWKAVWNDKRGKYDKIPCYPNGMGISTAKPDRWQSYATALQAYQGNPSHFAGVGYLMTGPHGVVGIDLDHCVTGNDIEPWAQEIVDQVATYTELSPSGTGLRMFSFGDIDVDWTNHEVGIEVYAGHEPRFLTVTGARLKQSVENITAAPEVIVALSGRYAPDRKAKATVVSLSIPEQLDDLSLPDLANLELPYKVRDFLTEGKAEGDRSGLIHAAGIALYSSGLADDQVYSLLANNPFVVEVALEHRRQDHDRALMYLWVEHCQKAKPKSSSRVATVDDFDDVSSLGGLVCEKPDAKPIRFAFQQAAQYLLRKPIVWAIKKVWPLAEIGVIYGESGVGKSFFALDLVMAIVTGTTWRGHKVRQGNVAYICAEGAGGFAIRVRAYAEHHGLLLTELPLHILGDAPNFLEKTDIKDLVAALRSLGKIDLVVVDTLAQVTAGANENSGEDMGRALSHCKVIHKAIGAMVMLVAHAGKDASRGIRGWSGIKGALDVEIFVERSDDARSATITKVKDGEGEGAVYPFKLDSVTVDHDEDGEPITSCVLKVGPAPVKAPKGPAAPVWQSVVMKTAIELTDLAGDVTTSQLVDAAVAQIPKDEVAKKDRRRERVLKAITDLSAAGRISIAGGKVVVL